MSNQKIHCHYDKLLTTEEAKSLFRPSNNNVHSSEQIERLAKILQYQGWRYPVKINAGDGLIVSGHGRVMAADVAKMEYIPVVFQTYENDEQVYADMTSDNSIAAWAEIDFAKINAELPNLGPDFDLDLLGIKDFNLNPGNIDLPGIGDGKDSMIIQRTFTLTTEQSDILDRAMEKAAAEEDCSDSINENKNGNILAAMAIAYARS